MSRGVFTPPYRLLITDGSTQVDLLNGPFYLEDWRPQTPNFKDGGTWRDSPIATGRRLVDKRLTNVIDTFRMKLSSNSPDTVIKFMRTLRQLLVKASDYWTSDWQNTPVYLVAQSRKETNIRYAMIHLARIPEDENPFGPVFNQVDERTVMDGLSLIVEHGIWQSTIPGEGTAVPVGVRWCYNLIPNYSFEEWSAGVPTSWTSVSSPTLTQSTDYVQTGAYSCRIQNASTQADRGIYIDITEVTNGIEYTISVIVYVDAAGGSVGCRLIAYDGGGTSNAVADQTGTATGYVALSVTKTAAAGGIRVAITANDAGASGYFDDIYLCRISGNVDSDGDLVTTTTENEVFIANKQNQAAITNIYNYDDSLTSFSGNLLDSSLPTTLFPGTAAVDDIVYFGSDDKLTNNGPFSSLIFDIGTAASAGTSYTLTWEYYNGGWVALSVDDNTSSFATIGVNSVVWQQPSDWAQTTINTVDGHWVRVRLSALTGAFTNPTQQNRDIYTVLWPYISVLDENIGGDIPALLRVRLREASAGINTTTAKRMFLALRSLSRGVDFTPYLNASNEQTVPGLTVTAGTQTTLSANPDSPTGSIALFNPTGTTSSYVTRVTYVFAPGLIAQYRGRFHAYVRCKQVGGTVGQINIKLSILPDSTGSTVVVTDYNTVGAVDVVDTVDFGEIVLPPSQEGNYTYGSFGISIQTNASSTTPDMYFYELILMPVDEWAASFTNLTGRAVGTGEYLDVDSVSYPDTVLTCVIRSVATNYVYDTMVNVSNGEAILQANANQRLWMFVARSDASDLYESRYETLFSVRISKAQRYESMRGSE